MRNDAILAMDELVDRVGDDRAFALELLGDFVRELEGLLAEISGLVRSGDLAELKAKAHSLKGSSANLSLKELSGRAAAIEAAAEGGDRERVQALEGGLIAAARRVLEYYPTLS